MLMSSIQTMLLLHMTVYPFYKGASTGVKDMSANREHNLITSVSVKLSCCQQTTAAVDI